MLTEATLVLNISNFIKLYVLVNLSIKYVIEHLEITGNNIFEASSVANFGDDNVFFIAPSFVVFFGNIGAWIPENSCLVFIGQLFSFSEYVDWFC